ncbi:MAG: hypothetical protein V4451_05830 [Pseudomonadota bacterium]
MSQARHIDRDARMIWLSLMRARRAMTVNELVMHWTPVFKPDLVEDALKRLTAAGHASFVAGGTRQQWQVSEADAVLPGYEGEADREWCRTGRSRSVPALLQARPDALHLGGAA